MANRGVAVDFLLSRRQGPLASPEIEHGPPALEGALHRLPAEEDDTVFVVGALDRSERRVVEGAGKIHPGDLRPEHGGGRNDFHRHRRLPRWLSMAASTAMLAHRGWRRPWILAPACRMVPAVPRFAARRERASSMARLNGKVAAVTGGASGIGEATVRRFVKEGAKVAFADRDAERGKRVAEEIAASGAGVVFVEAHVEREAEAAAFVRQAAQRFGRLDILVNNAGVRLYHTVEEASAETWDEILAVNLKAYASCAKAAIPLLRQAGG